MRFDNTGVGNRYNFAFIFIEIAWWCKMNVGKQGGNFVKRLTTLQKLQELYNRKKKCIRHSSHSVHHTR